MTPSGRRAPAPSGAATWLPILDWGRRYSRATLTDDLLAAVIVTLMLVPQSLAYALLAGLPPQVGLYASILPLVAYALFGTSRTLAVGPVAVLSLMTASAIAAVAPGGGEAAVEAALVLALLSGLMLLAMGALRLGLVANLLSHPVISGFITASGILIALSQARHVLGVEAGGHALPAMLGSLARALPGTNAATLAVGLSALLFLFWVRGGLAPMLARLGLAPRTAALAARAGPVAAVLIGILAVLALDLDARGVATVGAIPAGLPPLTLPSLDPALWVALAPAAALISIVGFVESVSVARTLAAKRRQSIRPDGELIGLGAANLAAGLSGGYPVTGGFARSVVNFDTGAQTPAAGAFTALGIALASVALTPLLASLPVAVLAATIIVAVLSLVDLAAIRRTWRYSRTDFAAMATTIALTLLVGVEAGIAAGVGLSVLLQLWRTSRPHVAVVGRVPGTEHYRNVERHAVVTSPHVLQIRIDESLTYLNAAAIEDIVAARVAECDALRHVVLQCSAVNAIDASALESLEMIAHGLADAGIALHLSEVKGPVMDRLRDTPFLAELTGEVFLAHHQAMAELDPGTLRDDAAPGIDRPRPAPVRRAW